MLFREVNERIRSLHQRSDSLAGGGEWVCECADPGCFEHVEMCMADYEAIRAHRYRFAALPGHDLPHGGRLLERRRGYVIFEWEEAA